MATITNMRDSVVTAMGLVTVVVAATDVVAVVVGGPNVVLVVFEVMRAILP